MASVCGHPAAYAGNPTRTLGENDMSYFDRFDICEAYFLALSHCHGGQWSREYARLCSMAAYFRPSPSLSVDTLNDNAREIYERACARMLGGDV